MKKSWAISAGVLVVIIIAAFFMFSGEVESFTSSSSKQIISITEMTASQVLQKMEQSNDAINKYDMEMSLTYDMTMNYADAPIISRMQISATGHFDKIKEEAYVKSIIINEDKGTKEITEMEIKDGYITEKRNGEVSNTVELEEGFWEEEVAKFSSISMDPYYISMEEEFQQIDDETINGVDYYVMIMNQSVQKSIESVYTGQIQVAKDQIDFPQGTGEVYVKVWLDKTDLHTVKSKTYLSITTENFSWLIDGEILISNIS